MSLEVRPYEPHLLNALVAFARETWPTRPASAAFVAWRYGAVPGLTGEVALENGRIAAVLLAVRRPWIVRGQPVERLETFDWYTAPDLRGSGIGVRLMQRMMRRDVPIVSVGGTADTRALLPRMRWAVIPAVQRFVLPLSWSAIGDRIHLPAAVAAPAGVAFNAVAVVGAWAIGRFARRDIIAERLGPSSIAQFADVLAQPTGHADTWNAPDAAAIAWLLDGARFGFHVEATGWRRGMCPVGLSVVRHYVDASGLREASIVALRAVDARGSTDRRALLGAMLRRVIADAAAAGCSLMRAQSTDAVELSVLRRHGFGLRGIDPMMFSSPADHAEGDRIDVCRLISDAAVVPYPLERMPVSGRPVGGSAESALRAAMD